MQMPILNIIISFLLFFQFSLGNLDILYGISNISQSEELHSVEECGEAGSGCRVIKILFFYRKCWCPPKPKNKWTIINIFHFMDLDNNKMVSLL